MKKIEATELGQLKQRFVTRAKAVFFTRLVFLALYFMVFIIPSWRHYLLDPLELWTFPWLLFSLFYTCWSFSVVKSPAFGRWAYFISLNLDLLWLTYIIASSGGLTSPAMAAGPVFTMFFALLFHSPIGILPPLLLLPVVTIIHTQIANDTPIFMQILVLLFYGVLNGVAVFLTTFSLSQEEQQNSKIIRLEKQLKRLAVVEERNRLSREIHDGLGASLSALTIQTEYVQSLVKGSKQIDEELASLRATARESIDELRRVVTVMRDEFELVPQLENFCNTFAKRHKIPARLRTLGTVPNLTDEEKLTTFRILQESLSNAVKHADASQITIDVDFSKNRLGMLIQDNGIGFDVHRTYKHHYGLLSMRERAKKIGGEIHINSSPGKGTQIQLKIPAGQSRMR